MRRLTSYALLAVLILGSGVGIGLGVSEAPTAMRPPARSEPTCRASQLTLAITNSGNGAGSVYLVGTFESLAAGKCKLGGFPTLEMLSGDGTAIKTTLRRDTTSFHGEALPEIDVGRGQQVSFVITASDGNQFLLGSLPRCPTASSLLVTPPGDSQGLRAVIPSGGGHPPGLTAYPYTPGEPCGTVAVTALIAGSAARALCPACYSPPPGEVPADRRG
jgi:hypothetical protein